MRVLFAGGGTGDGLILFATKCQALGCPVEIDYLDVSEASLSIAQERAAVRGLRNIQFHLDSVLNASHYGTYDYIDCCGVLHHLPTPLEGFQTLRSVLKDDGGLGAMVYAPFGRSGVYPLQAAFRTLLGDAPQGEGLPIAKDILRRLPEAHIFKRNQMVQDHTESDAGFVDLLLHSQDRAYTVPELLQTLDDADFELVSFVEP